MEPKDNQKKETEELKKKCEEYLNGWKRERADFINYKKDEVERIGMLARYAKEEMVLKMLPFLDTIIMASEQMPSELQKSTWAQGFLQIQNQMSEFLSREGVEVVKTAGQPFDPSTMEVIEEVVIEGGQSGTVASEAQKGYTLDGKLVRPAKVTVIK